MRKYLIKAFYVLFSICFTFVIINIIFKNSSFETSRLVVLFPICIAGLVVIYKLLGRYCSFLKATEKTERMYYRILIVFSIIMLAAEIIFGIMLRTDPMWDVGAIHKGAAELVNLKALKEYHEYFSLFPNNLGGMVFLSLFLKIASLFGITDYYAVSVVVTSVMITAASVLVSLICHRLAGVNQALFALVLFVVSVQFWFMGGAVYTDTMSMMFPILTFWLYLISKEKHGKAKILIYLLMGASAAIGMLIKITAVIIAIAIAIDMCLKEKPVNILKGIICMTAVIGVAMSGLNIYVYSNYLDKDYVYKTERPYTHWIMMGLKGDGRYNPGDYEFTDSFSDPKEKRREINNEILNRVKERGISGLFDLAIKKSVMDFGDGTYGIGDVLGMPPKTDTRLHDWILSDGEHYKTYSTYATALHIALMLLMLFGAYMSVFNKNERGNELFAMYLGIFGVWLFLLAWETNRRYFSNFAPVILTCAALNMDIFIDILNKKSKDGFKKWKGMKPLSKCTQGQK